MRDKLINNILLQMGDCLDTYQLQKLRTVLTINLNDYDLTPHKLELTTFKNKTDNQEEKIQELKKHYEVNKNMITGIAMTVITTIIIAIIKLVATSL